MSYDGRMNYQNRLGMERLAFKAAYPLTPIEQPRMSGEGGPAHLYTPSLYKLCRSKKSGLQLGTHDRGKVTCKACLKLMNLSVPHQQPPCGSPAGDSSPMDAVRDSDAKIHLSAMQCSSSGSTPLWLRLARGFFWLKLETKMAHDLLMKCRRCREVLVIPREVAGQPSHPVACIHCGEDLWLVGLPWRRDRNPSNRLICPQLGEGSGHERTD